MLPVRKSYRPVYLSDFFNNDFDSFFNPGYNYSPAVNVKEDDKGYNIEMALPGQDKNDIKIEIEKDTLIISSEKKTSKEEEKKNYSRREFGYQSFCKSFSLPENADTENISASFTNGVLNVEIPRSKEDTKLSRVIKVS